MNKRKSAEGSSSLGLVLTMLIVGYGGLGMFKFYPIHSGHYAYKDQVLQILKNHNRNDNTKTIKKKILQAGLRLQIPVNPNDIVVMKRHRKWSASVDYSQTLSLPGYSRTFDYEIKRTWQLY